MKTTSLVAVLLMLSVSCATTETTSTTWTAPPVGGPGQPQVMPGRVESVREVVQRVQGNPAGGAVAGALIGGLLFGRGPARVVGAAGGAAVGAAASQGSGEARTYQVFVRFDDGSYGEFTYRDFSPFRPGEPVVLTPQGLARA